MSSRSRFRDPYATTFEATIATITQSEVELTDTWFVPETVEREGDLGLIDGCPVSRVMRNEHGSVIHGLLDSRHGRAFEPGQRVQAEIDWERRYRLMRLHTGLHLAYFGFQATHGPTGRVRRNVSGTEATLELTHQLASAAALDPGQLVAWIEQAIADDLAITSWAPSARARRSWHVDGVGTVACSGLHPHRTREVGEVDFEVRVSGERTILVCLTLRDGVVVPPIPARTLSPASSPSARP